MPMFDTKHQGISRLMGGLGFLLLTITTELLANDLDLDVIHMITTMQIVFLSIFRSHMLTVTLQQHCETSTQAIQKSPTGDG